MNIQGSTDAELIAAWDRGRRAGLEEAREGDGGSMSEFAVWYDGEDWVIADSQEDATAICADLYGEYEGEGEWRKLPNDKVISIAEDDGQVLKLTCAQWVVRNGRGHLCSLDY